nr:cellulose binding domain-containing protein [uncultured Halomonas sp.]
MSGSKIIKAGTKISAQELEELINEAPKGATIKLSSGDYHFDDAINITRSDVSLIGAGSDKTTLTFTDKALQNNSEYAIHLDGYRSEYQGRLEGDIDEGDRTLKLDRDHDLEEGDTIRIWQDNDSDFFKEIGDDSWKKTKYAELRTSMAKVTEVNGDRITLDRGVKFDFDDNDTQIQRLDTVDNVTLKGFNVEFELGSPDDANFSNTRSAYDDYRAISLEGTTDTEVKDIEVHDGPSTAFRFSKSLDLDVDNIEAHGAFNKGGGGNGYAYELHESYDGDFTNLSDSGMRHSVIFASWRSSVDNDIQVDSTDRDINFHGGRDHGNTVHVERSVRDADADKMSTTLWVNSGGESFGAITDADANEVTFEHVVGSRRDDTLQGCDEDSYLAGERGNDTIHGGDGDDELKGGQGDDKLNGGDGNDTAIYSGDYDDYDIDFKDDGRVIIEGEDGRDELKNMEKAKFGDGKELRLNSGDEEEVSAAEPTVTSSESRKEAADTGFEITGNITSEWSSGYVAEVFVTNTSDSDLVNPTIHFELGAELHTVWNGEFEGSDGRYSVTDDDANTLAPGETWRFAYKAYGDEKTLPKNASVQGSDEETASVEPALALSGQLTSDWSNGYVAEIFVENTSENDIVVPQLQFDLDADLHTVWNGEFEGSDGRYSVTDDDAITLAPGEVWRFAYKAYGDEGDLLENVTAQDANGDSLGVELVGMNTAMIVDVA